MTKPLLILKSPLTNKYYATRAYKYLDEGNGHLQVTGKKEDVTDQIERHIENANRTDERAEMQAAIAELRLALEKVKGEGFEDSEFGTLIEQTLNNTKKWSEQR